MYGLVYSNVPPAQIRLSAADVMADPDQVAQSLIEDITARLKALSE